MTCTKEKNVSFVAPPLACSERITPSAVPQPAVASEPVADRQNPSLAVTTATSLQGIGTMIYYYILLIYYYY